MIKSPLSYNFCNSSNLSQGFVQAIDSEHYMFHEIYMMITLPAFSLK